MGFLKRVLGGDRGPDWTGGMSGDEYRAFIAAVEAEQRRRDKTFRIEDDGLFVDQPGGGEPQVFGLSNLAQLCHQLDRSEWATAIESHFNNLDAAIAEDAAYNDLENARPFLKVRVYPHEALPPEAHEKLVMRPLTNDLLAALVLDLPSTVRSLNTDVVAGWAAPTDELWELGLDHLRAEMPTYARDEVKIDGNVPVQVVTGDSFFVASQVVRFGEIVGDAANGAIVLVPTRHTIAWHPLSSGQAAIKAVQGMIGIGHEMYQHGPGSVTPNLYWWRNGVLTVLPASIDKGKVNFYPPDDFMEMLNGLP